MPDAFFQVLPAFTTRETIPSYIPKREVSRRGQMNSKSMLSILYSSTVIVQLATFVFLYWLSCSIFFSMASLQGSVLYLMCVFLKKKKQKKMTTSVYCRCLCQVHLVGLVCLPPFLFFRPGFFLLCSRFMMTHWNHCLLLWGFMQQYVTRLRSLSTWEINAAWMICRLLSVSSEKPLYPVMNFFFS